MSKPFESYRPWPKPSVIAPTGDDDTIYEEVAGFDPAVADAVSRRIEAIAALVTAIWDIVGFHEETKRLIKLGVSLAEENGDGATQQDLTPDVTKLIITESSSQDVLA